MANHRTPGGKRSSGQGYFWLILVVAIGIGLVCSGTLQGLGLSW